MTVDLMKAPFPITVRELWLPRAINGNATLPSSRYNGHPLALTGARKGTTVDGVHGTGAANSNINAGANAVDNAAAKYWVSLRFRPDVDWTAGDGSQFLWGKWVDGTHYIQAALNTGTGNVRFYKNEGGPSFDLEIVSPDGDGIWHAGVWYHILCSISDAAGARFKVNDADLQTDVDNNPVPNGGDLCFLDNDDPGAGFGFVGTEVDIFCGTDDLTGAEETALYNGIPPADAVHAYPLDEGRGVTAYDRGSGADNATLDAVCSWEWGSCRHPVLSLDGINDRAVSSGGVDIGGEMTLVWAGKMKSTYEAGCGNHRLAWIFIGADYLGITAYTGGYSRYYYEVGGVSVYFEFNLHPDIDDYLILIATASLLTRRLELLINGSLIGGQNGIGDMPRQIQTCYLGGDNLPANFDISKPLFVGLIDGAFTQKQALAYSRWLDNIFNMEIGI